jgi:hypothetical protein
VEGELMNAADLDRIEDIAERWNGVTLSQETARDLVALARLGLSNPQPLLDELRAMGHEPHVYWVGFDDEPQWECDVFFGDRVHEGYGATVHVAVAAALAQAKEQADQ